MTVITTETWTGTTGAAWPSQWATGTTGTGSSATIQTNVGRLTNGTAAAYAGAGRISRRLTTGNIADGCVLFRFRWPTSGLNNNYVGFWFRSNGSNANLLDGQRGLIFQAAADFGGWKLTAADAYGALSGFTEVSVTKSWAVNQWYWVRFGVVGSDIKARVWNDGTSEPSTWDATSTQGNLLTGTGAWGFSIGQGANPSAVTEFDDFSADTAFPATATNYNVTTSQTVTANSVVTGVVGKSGVVSGTITAASLVQAPAAKTSALKDTFSFDDTSKWDGYGDPNLATSGGQLRITPAPSYPSIFSHNQYNFVGDSASLQVVQYPNTGNGTVQAFILQLRLDGNNVVQWLFTGSSIIADYVVGGAGTALATATPSTDFNWLRLTESGGVVNWDRSTDGVTWINFASQTVPYAKTAMSYYTSAGYYGTEPNPGVLIVDNLNLPPIAASVSGTASAGSALVGQTGRAGDVSIAENAVYTVSASVGQSSGTSATTAAGHSVSGRVGLSSTVAQTITAGSVIGSGKTSPVTGTETATSTVTAALGRVSGTTAAIASAHAVSGVVGKVSGVIGTETMVPAVSTGVAGNVSQTVTALANVDGAVTVQGAVSSPMNIGGFLSAADGLSGAFTVNQAVPVGRFVVVNVVTNGATPGLSIADSKANSWAQMASASRSTGTTTTATAFYAFITNALTTSDTITVTRSTSGTLLTSGMMFTGVNTVTPIDNGGVQATASGTSATPSSGALANVGSKSAVVMIAGFGTFYITAMPGTGYTEFADASSMGANARGATVVYRDTSSGGSYTPSANLGMSNDWVAMGFALTASGVSANVSQVTTAGSTVSGSIVKTSGVNQIVTAGSVVSGASGPAGGVTASASAGHVVSGAVSLGSLTVYGTVNAVAQVSGPVGSIAAVSGQATAAHTVSGFVITGPSAQVSDTVSPVSVTAVRLGKTAGVNASISPAVQTVTRLGIRADTIAGVVIASHDVRPSLGERASVTGTASAIATVIGMVLTGNEVTSGYVVGGDDQRYFVRENQDFEAGPVVIGAE